MPRFIGRFLAIVLVAARRLWSNRWLSLAAASGFAVVVVFVLCVPLYSDAVYHRVLSKELGVVRDDGPRLPPFAFVFRNGTYWLQTDPWSDIQRADDFIDRQLPFFLRLPRRGLMRYLQTARLEIRPAAGLDYGQTSQPLLKAPLTTVSGFGQHIRLTEGELPPAFAEPGFALDGAPAAATADGAPVPVLVSRLLADELGIQIGDRYDASTERGLSISLTVPMVVAGVWLPLDPAEPYWFNKPYQMGRMFIVSQRDFTERLAPRLGNQLADALWYADFDGDGVRVWDVPALLARIDDLIQRGKTPGLNLSVSVSPQVALERYQQGAQALQSQLYAFSVPVFVLALAFVLLVAGLTANDQRNEVAVLRSRGASMSQTVGMALLQAALAGAAGALAALPLSLLVVSWLGQIRSFLNFSGTEPLAVTVTAAGLPLGAAAAAATILLMTLPALESARHTIVTYKAERARALKPPWWQRIGLDILLLIPAAYWTYLLNKEGALNIFGATASATASAADSPFGNPTLFLLPALSMLALTLLFVRVLPLLLRALAWLAGRLPGAALVLALRELARSPGFYTTPVLLLTLTLAMATYTASLAATLDLHLEQQTRYEVGADLRLLSTGQAAQPSDDAWFTPSAGDAAPGSAGADADAEAGPSGPRWLFLPVTDYLKAPGVVDAARGGNYEMIVRYALGGQVGGRFLGIDRNDFARVAFWRADFAGQPLMSLMNALAAAPEGVLVPESVLKSNGLQIGDSLPVTLIFPGTRAEASLLLKIVGSFNLWPTWYPNVKGGQAMFVGNLDYVFETIGGQMPYDVWLKTRPGADPQSVVAQLRAIDREDWKHRDVQTLIVEEQIRPQRQGLFGMLSIGFVAASLMTLLGFFLYALFSYRRRYVELGVLRAIGLDVRQMAGVLAVELACLLAVGLAAGSLIGVWASNTYIPFLQPAAGSESRAVPFLLIIDWPRIAMIYLLYAGLLAAAVAALALFLRRLRVFQAIKLGETV